MNLYLMKTNYSLLSACLAILPFQGYAQKQAKGIICLFSYPPFSGIRTETGKRDETEYSVYLCGRSSAGIGRIWLFGENT